MEISKGGARYRVAFGKNDISLVNVEVYPMNGRERFFALMQGKPVDRLPVMPITMLFAAEQVGPPYGRYALDYRVLVESQLRTAERFDFDHVSAITETREAPDCGACVRYFDDQPYALDESQALLADKSAFRKLAPPDPYTATT